MKTKKILLITIPLLLILCATSSFAQSDNTTPQTFTKGMNVINLGVGIGGAYSYWGAGYTETPNFVVSYENGTFDNVGPGIITLGGLFSYKGIGYSSINNGNGYTYTDKWNYYILGFRAAYHWNFTQSTKFDPYAGLMLGYYIVSHSYSTNDPNANLPGDPGYVYYTATYPSYIGASIFIGARYYLSDKVGIWAELGYGYTDLALGVNFKL